MQNQETEHSGDNPDGYDRHALSGAAAAARIGGAEPPTARGVGYSYKGEGLGSGAPPSNTAPANCIEVTNSPIKVFRSGIDSLYLSYPGSLFYERSIELDTLKNQARSDYELEQAEAIYPIKDHLFEVHGKGAGLYVYLLTDNAYRISLSGLSAKQLPLAYVQIKSDWLVFKGVLGACAELDELIQHFGECEDSKVSRADLFVDFACSFPFETLPVSAWVSRARRISSHTMSRAFTGFSIGLGGDLSARLYDKTREIEESGKNYLRKLWLGQGWDGQSTVWRLEFQYKRKTLTEHKAGTVPELLDRLRSLWRYSTTSWLKLTIPSFTDTTQSRWPMHPVWQALADISFDQPDQSVSIPVRSSDSPSDQRLFVQGLASITSFMGREGITDVDEAFERFKQDAESYHLYYGQFSGKSFHQYLIEKAAFKARRFNKAFPGISEEAKAKTTKAKAKAYRKAKDGE